MKITDDLIFYILINPASFGIYLNVIFADISYKHLQKLQC